MHLEVTDGKDEELVPLGAIAFTGLD